MRLPLAAAVVAAAVAAGACSSGTHQATGARASAAAVPASASPGPSAAPPVSDGAPGCSTATASAATLRTVPTSLEPVPGTPFGVVVTADGRWSFVSMPSSGSVGVFRIGHPALPSLAGQVDTGAQVLGEALTPGGRYLLAADDAEGAVVINVSQAESGGAHAQVETLGGRAVGGAIEVAVSPDGRFAFVSLEDSASIAVYNLQQGLAKGFGRSDLVGMIPVGIAPVGLAVSPDGQWLYATSELAAGGSASSGQGTLSVISLGRAETDPAGSVVSTVDAGCSPVRVITSADGGVVWVTARESDRLLGFAAARLRTNPAQSLIASVQVGEAPVGLTLADSGTRIVVADSNRFSAPNATSSLAVVSVPAALAGRPSLIGYLPAARFPREMALEPDGKTLLVTNFSSQQLEAVGVAGLP